MPDLSPEDKQFLTEAVAQVLAESKQGGYPPPAPATQAPAPFKMTIAGQEYTFASPEEAGQKMTEFVHAAQNMVATPPAKPTAPIASVAGNDAPEFNMDTYAEYMTRGDVPKGLEYGFKSVFGVGAEDLKKKLAKVDELNNTLAVYQFRDRHPEISKMPPQAGQAIEHVRQSLGLPFNAEGLDAAYFYAQQRGMIQAPPKAEEPEVKTPAGPTPAMLTPTPHISRSGDTNAGYSLDDMENMTEAQLEAVIRKMAPR